MKEEKTKKFSIKKLLLLIVAVILLIGTILPMIFAQINYAHNKEAYLSFSEYTTEGFINNQSATDVFNYGLRTGANAGCGFIAAFNVFTHLTANGKYDKPINLPNIIKELDTTATLAFGYLGTNPYVLTWYLQSKGLDVDIIYDSAKFDETARNSDANIMLYIDNELGYAHYQMFYDYDGNDYRFLTPTRTRTMQEFLDYMEGDRKDWVYMLSINA